MKSDSFGKKDHWLFLLLCDKIIFCVALILKTLEAEVAKIKEENHSLVIRNE